MNIRNIKCKQTRCVIKHNVPCTRYSIIILYVQAFIFMKIVLTFSVTQSTEIYTN